MGNEKMKCLVCGTSDVNDMLVTFKRRYGNGEIGVDTTTVPKFLYYLEHPKGKHEPKGIGDVVEVIGFSCDHCIGTTHIGLDSLIPSIRIPTTKYGV